MSSEDQQRPLPLGSPPPADEATAAPSDAESSEDEIEIDESRYDVGCKYVRRYTVHDVSTFRSAINDNLNVVLTNDHDLDAVTTISNVRLVVAAIGVAFAIFSHVVPVPFPDNAPILMVCIVVYYASVAVVLYMLRYLEVDAFFLGRVKGAPKLLRLTAKTAAFSPGYELKAEVLQAGPWYRPSKVIGTAVTFQWHASRFFTERGLISPPAVQKAVADILSETKFL
jgi:hypothetical protein